MSQIGSRQRSFCSSDPTCASTGHIRVQFFSSNELHQAAFKYLLNTEDGFLLECTKHELPIDLDRFKQERPDLAFIDMALWPGGALRFTQDILAALCHLTSVILLIDQIDTFSLRAMLACGIHGYLLTSVSLSEFRQMLQVVLTGGRWLGPTTSTRPPAPISASYAVAGDPVIRDLSQRELEILKNVARGKTSKEIARMLCLSESSVRTYWYRVLSKLNALNKIEAVVRAGQIGLLEPGSF